MNAKILEKFINLVSMNGRGLTKFQVVPGTDGAKVNVMSTDNTIMVSGYLKNFKIPKALNVKDAAGFIDAIKFVGGDLTYEKRENSFHMSSKTNGRTRTQRVGLADAEYMSDAIITQETNFEYAGSVEVQTKELADIVSKYEKLGQKLISIEVKDNVMTLSTEGDTDDASIKIPVEYYDSKGYYGMPFADVVKVLSHDVVKVALNKEKSEYPVKLSVEDDNMVVSYIVAPKSKDTDEDSRSQQEEPEPESEPEQQEEAE